MFSIPIVKNVVSGENHDLFSHKAEKNTFSTIHEWSNMFSVSEMLPREVNIEQRIDVSQSSIYYDFFKLEPNPLDRRGSTMHVLR